MVRVRAGFRRSRNNSDTSDPRVWLHRMITREDVRAYRVRRAVITEAVDTPSLKCVATEAIMTE